MKLRVVFPPSAWRTVARSCLLVLAIVCLGLYSYSYLERNAYQAYASWKFDKTPEATGPAISNDRVAPVSRGSRRVSLSRPAPPNALIGRLSVPRLHLS